MRAFEAENMALKKLNEAKFILQNEGRRRQQGSPILL